MPSAFPGGLDSFNEPSLPEETTLSSAGTGTRNHVEHHRDLGDAIEAIEANVSLKGHTHDGTAEVKLAQANTHQSADTDSGSAAIHHTLGPGGYQAAPGNHTHPALASNYVLCTSSTRPVAPFLGLMIFETDTSAFRIWSSFPGNTLVAGTQYSDDFNRVNNTNLGTDYTQSYVTGTSPANGLMAIPFSGYASWGGGSNATCRCIAQSIASGDATTQTDDQSLIFVTGNKVLDVPDITFASPTNDVYLRMSADGQSYVRLLLTNTTAQFTYTTSGPANEKSLGTASAGTLSPNITWEAQAVGRTFTLYRGGVSILTVNDSQNATRMGAANRGWGFGMSATQGFTTQHTPANIDSVSIRDMPTYTSTPIWQLLPSGATPYVRAETHVGQQIAVTNFVAAFFDTVLEDIFGFFGHGQIGSQVSIPAATDINITETGHYDVHASIPWDPTTFGMDHGMVGFTVNGVDIGRKNWEFIRGNGYTPGFSQTNEISMHWHFARGDVLRVVAAHNAANPVQLFASTAAGTKQVVYVDLKFTGP